MIQYVKYSSDMEKIPANELETIDQIGTMMLDLAEKVREKHGVAMKGTHAKSVGLAKAELTVLASLPPELAQGLFAHVGTYEALVRYAPGPPEKLSDKASGQRGMSVKILGVRGPHLAESSETTTQDFVLAVDPAFTSGNAKQFLQSFGRTAAHAPEFSEKTIIGASRVARVMEGALEAVGLESANLKFVGRPPRHPVSDPYYSQAPMRYGQFVAKLAAFPTAATLALVGKREVDTEDDEVFRHVTEEYFKRAEAVYAIKVQLCTDEKAMPIEDASVVWPEESSPYRTVAMLRIPMQHSFSEARRAYFEDNLSFNPVHSLEQHRPLGSIMRARMAVYKKVQEFRQASNGTPPAEPASLAVVPD